MMGVSSLPRASFYGALERDWLYARGQAIEVGRAVKCDPRLRAAWDVWSRCVAQQGFTRCRDPVAVYTDDAWQQDSDGNTRHAQRERAIAVADVTCRRRRHRTAELWHRSGAFGPKDRVGLSLHLTAGGATPCQDLHLKAVRDLRAEGPGALSG